MPSLIDAYLVFRLRTKRDAEAFGQIYDRYVVSIYRFVYLKLPSKEIAEDVTSETFLRCWEYVQSASSISNIRALLYRIARNLVADFYRKQQENSKNGGVVTFSIEETSSYIEGLSDGARGKERMEASAEAAMLLRRIAKLKEDFQDVLTLRLVDGLGFSDIASILEKSPGNVRVIYHRAMKALNLLD